MTTPEEIAKFYALAAEPLSASDGNGLADSMLKVSAAVARVGEILTDAQEGLLHCEGRHRLEQQSKLGPDVSEARLSAEVARRTITERIVVKRAETLLVALRDRFRAAQSALRHLDAEMRL